MPAEPRKFLTESEAFRDVSRGNPKPFSLQGEALVKARLTPESWRLEIVSDGSSEVAKPRRLEDGTAIDLATLEGLARKRGVKFLKAMQCLNIPQPLGQGLWEGVPLRDVIGLAGKINKVRRIYYHGFHNNDPKQMFRGSLSYSQVMEAPPWDLGVFVAFRLNGKPLSLRRGGPVRLVAPWTYGHKSVKWLQRITLTWDYKANDTYAEAGNDPDAPQKTAAYLDDNPHVFKAGADIVLRGTALVGWSGLKRIEYWIRPDAGNHGKLAEDDPAWQTALAAVCDRSASRGLECLAA